MRVAMEEDLPSCARLRRGASFSHRGRGASLAPRCPDGLGFGALYASVRDNRKGQERLCREPGEVSPQVAISPPKSTNRSRNTLAPTWRAPGPEYGVCPTHARGCALADSQDQRHLSNLATSRLVGSLAWTIDVVCAELGKQDAEMPSRRDITSARAVLLPLAGPHPRPHSIQVVLLPLPGPHLHLHLVFRGAYV